MSDFIKINENHILQASENIKAINDRIDSDFNTFYKNVTQYLSSWQSDNTNNAMQCVKKIKNVYGAESHTVINNYKVFLDKTVATNYRNTETKLENEAEKFEDSNAIKAFK